MTLSFNHIMSQITTDFENDAFQDTTFSNGINVVTLAEDINIFW
jgi:hypothetical protein